MAAKKKAAAAPKTPEPKAGDGLRYVGRHPRARVPDTRLYIDRGRCGMVLVGFPPEGLDAEGLREQGCAGTVNVSTARRLLEGGEFDLVTAWGKTLKARKKPAPAAAPAPSSDSESAPAGE